MKIYLFNRIDSQNRSEFRAHYVHENLIAVKKVAVAYITVGITLKLVAFFLHRSIDNIVQIPDLNSTINISFGILLLFFLSAELLIRKFSQQSTFLLLAKIFTLMFAMFFVSRGMANTFNAVHNPRNTLTMYMICLVTVSVFFVIEYYETMLLMAFCLIVFSIMLSYSQLNHDEVIKNGFVSVLLVIMFFFLSRYFFSYKLNHFVQLKTISDKSQQIENAIHLKDEILGIVAHDLRNPLAAIESITMLMELDSDNFDENTRDNLTMIKASCEKARFIINDLIEVARNDNEAGDSFGIDKTDMNEFLSNIVDEWNLNRTSNTTLIFNGTGQPSFVWINKEKIQRVMDNLISNAIKFSPVDSTVHVSLKQGQGKCYISVTDSGMGIPKDLLPYIFDRFSKASRKGIRGEDSIGLGLSIVRQIVRKHGGDITVESIEKHGTTFTIALPQKLASLSLA